MIGNFASVRSTVNAQSRSLKIQVLASAARAASGGSAERQHDGAVDPQSAGAVDLRRLEHLVRQVAHEAVEHEGEEAHAEADLDDDQRKQGVVDADQLADLGHGDQQDLRRQQVARQHQQQDGAAERDAVAAEREGRQRGQEQHRDHGGRS